MGQTTGISWTDATWNPWQGCHKVSPGCKHCYMYSDKARYGQDPAQVVRSKDATFYAPIQWEKQAQRDGIQRRVFTCSWSDFFIEEADAWRDEAFAIMAITPHLTYQVLTKRPERMLLYLDNALEDICAHLKNLPTLHRYSVRYWQEYGQDFYDVAQWPLPNVWVGVSVENRATLPRIQLLQQAPAALRFLSLEPLLENLGELDLTGIKWVIVGGESGADARPCDLDWIRRIARQCERAQVPCWVKQVGASPTLHGFTGMPLTDRKGANPDDWPDYLRIQQFPEVPHVG